jgi:hypothetical protein
MDDAHSRAGPDAASASVRPLQQWRRLQHRREALQEELQKRASTVGVTDETRGGAAVWAVARQMHDPVPTQICGSTPESTVRRCVMSLKLMSVPALALLAIVGCSRAESPSEVREDVREARADAVEDVNDARKDQMEAIEDAQHDVAEEAHDVSEESRDAMAAGQESEYDVAIAKAEGEAKIAKEQCEAMSGDAQEACKERAEANLNLAKSNAKARYPDAD